MLKINLAGCATALVLALASGNALAVKNFVYCSEGSPSNFNPQISTDGTTYNTTRALYNRLVEFKNGETVLIPGLAESWTVAPNGLTYTFKLRKGVKWHETAKFKPTRDFNADDVLFSFNRQRDPNHPFNKVNGGNYEYFDSMEMKGLIGDITKNGDYEVSFTLTHPEAPFIANLAMDFASILSAEYGDALMKAKTPEKIDWEPVGTGPFVFGGYEKDQTVRFKSNPTFFRGKPALDNLIFSITTDSSVRFQKLKTGECQFMFGPAFQDLKAMKADPKLQVVSGEGLNIGYLSMNVEKKPFDNVKVRQAVNFALNRKAYIDAVYMGNGVVAKNPMPPSMWSYNNAIKDYDYNPEKSKALLKEAGLPDGFETDLWTMPVERPYMPNGKKLGEMMQADLAKVGIKVKLVTFDWPIYLEKSKKGEHSMLQMGWTGDNGDPDNFLNVLLSCSAVAAGGNRSRWCNKEFDDLIQKARLTTKVEERSKLYAKAQEIFKREAPWVTVAHSVVFKTMAKNVQGYKLDPFGGDYFDQVDLSAK